MWSLIKSFFRDDDPGINKAQLDALLNHSVQALREGADPAQAIGPLEHTLAGLVESAPGTHLLAQAYYNAACINLAVGDNERAATHLRAAAAIPGSDHDSSKDQLTYLMNLGDVLTRLGQLEEAEACLRDGLTRREAFYGADHPGVAFGLTPLASNLLAQGRGAEALPLIDRAVEINGAAGQAEVAGDLALRAFVIKQTQGADAVAFEGWDDWDPEFQVDVLDGVAFRAESAKGKEEAALVVAVLDELAPQLDANLPAQVLMNVNAMICNAAQLTGDTAAQLRAGGRVLALAEEEEEPARIVNALEGLALAHSQAEDHAAAEEHYRRALAAAGDDAALRAGPLRNLGLFFSELERHEDAGKTLQEAVDAAEASEDPLVQGRCLAAQGIFLQHRGQLEEAGAPLDRALGLLPAAHPDRFSAMSHLLALEQQGACGCDEETNQEAAAAIVEEIVRRSAPEGLLEHLQLSEDGVEVRLSREPEPEELETLNRLIELAKAQLRQAAARSPYR